VPPKSSDRGGHYFEEQPAAAQRPSTVDLLTAEGVVRLHTDRGVFSHSGVDVGTKVLLTEGPRPAARGLLVDLGCGYGPIAVTLARRSPDARVWATDVNARARELCERNAAELGLLNVEVHGPDEVPDAPIDELWSNPPIRIGKRPLHDLLGSWLERLAPDGRALLVVQRNLGADSLARWLGHEGWPTERLLSRQGYRILEVRPRATAATD